MFVNIDSKDQMSIEDLGGKGFGLWEMKKQGLNVPPALVIPTNFCMEYLENPSKVSGWLNERLDDALQFFVDTFGYMPLLSVRSGARVSMPGMMDTILNVGLDPTTMSFWSEKLGASCVEDSYRRLIEMYGSVVEGIDREEFEGLDVAGRLQLFKDHTGKEFPNARDQILNSIKAVFTSWNNERAKIYRKMHNIPDSWGTAVVLQAMVFGNFNDNSATGVLFTRNPDNGLAKVTGEFLVNAQGEDVVAGIKTPNKLEEMDSWNPEVFQELMQTVLALETARRDVQDVEFTIQDGKLFILQTRNAKRSAKAAVVIALDMVKEGLISSKEALERVSRAQYDLLKKPVINPSFSEEPKFTGIPACSGVVSGVVVLSAADAISCNKPCILVSKETTPDDIGGMAAAVGIITMLGGSTSHAAVVARGMDRPCVVGVGADITQFKAGQVVSIDGATGRIWFSEVPVIDNSDCQELKDFLDMLCEELKVKLITDEPKKASPMLDLSEHITDTAACMKLLKERLSFPGEVIVDICPEGAQLDFIGLFADVDKLQDALLKEISNLPKDSLDRVRVYSSRSSTKVQMIQKVKTLEELVMASGNFVLDLVVNSTGPVQKVVGWKLNEGCKSMSFGSYVAGGESYMSVDQALAVCLK